MEDINKAQLIISSKTYSCEEIDQKVGLSCDEAWAVGDMREIGGKDHRNKVRKGKMIDNGWIINSNLSGKSPLEHHIENLLIKLFPYLQNIKELSNECDVQVLCISWRDMGATMPIFLDKKFIKSIYDLGARVDFDLFTAGN